MAHLCHDLLSAGKPLMKPVDSDTVRTTFEGLSRELGFRKLRKYWYKDLGRVRLYLHLRRYTFGAQFDMDSGIDFSEFTPTYPYRQDLRECALNAPLSTFCDRRSRVLDSLRAYDDEASISPELRREIIRRDILACEKYYSVFLAGLSEVTPERVFLPSDVGRGTKSHQPEISKDLRRHLFGEQYRRNSDIFPEADD
ncbi:MAG: hypothetical protein HONBIEJF_02862 [Fimbriimonadaceae bacterium]|nr:hypothetical protein [Fimbriimonadaceae bacterium]